MDSRCRVFVSLLSYGFFLYLACQVPPVIVQRACPLNKSCSADADCCISNYANSQICLNGRCQACSSGGVNCTSNSNCCSSVCDVGVCTSIYRCGFVGQSCDLLPCCNGICYNQTVCTSCLYVGACTNNSDCCYNQCKNRSCCYTFLGGSCSNDSNCCGTNVKCQRSTCCATILGPASSCSYNEQSCTGICYNGKCCANLGQPCANNSECCFGPCTGGKCCTANGNPCNGTSVCCSGNCNGGRCIEPCDGQATTGTPIACPTSGMPTTFSSFVCPNQTSLTQAKFNTNVNRITAKPRPFPSVEFQVEVQKNQEESSVAGAKVEFSNLFEIFVKKFGKK